MLFLVRHGRPILERGLVPSMWQLDPAGFDDIWALRESGRLPSSATWYSSPEPKAVATAHLLTDSEVGIVDDLREQFRDTDAWLHDFDGAVRRAFADPDRGLVLSHLTRRS
jgi:hypothetical protein